MTAVWGPLGWITLHSVAALYPETPTYAEKQLVTSWLNLFRDTITCPHCQSHFGEMLALYRKKFPMMLDSRQELLAFTFRAHNVVNRRLHKPIYSTVAECMAILQSNLAHRTAEDYRTAYLTHVRKYWSSLRDVTGIVGAKKVVEMWKIEKDYFAPRDNNLEIEPEETIVVLPYGVIDKAPDMTSINPYLRERMRAKALPQTESPSLLVAQPPPIVRPPSGFRLTSQGLRLRR
jgi:hypothetical protein